MHQLLVSLSRNYYVGADGNLKFQKKPFEFSFETVERCKKRLMVSYLLRDHYSGVYYAEATTHDRLLNLGSFLFRAWSTKDGFDFHGMPCALMVPQLVLNKWPPLLDLLKEHAIALLKPASGFQTGMIDVKNWQRDFYWNAFDYSREPGRWEDYNFGSLRDKQLQVCISAADRRIGPEKRSKLDKWRASEAELEEPTDPAGFERHFAKTGNPSCLVQS